MSRIDPMTMLIDQYNWQREHLVSTLDGLSEADMRRSHVRSGWTPLQVVHHLLHDVERFWFRGVIAGEPDFIASELPNGWRMDDAVLTADVMAMYREECAHSNEILRSRAFDAAPAWWPDDEAMGAPMTSIYKAVLHAFTDTTVHAGQLDIVRESIDGHQWLVLDNSFD
jgi:uncharacterized damage-inducible protein DinB